ncbi:MAG TPA: hypothetical protein VN725_10090 [Rhodanobacteraceae bacterium]|nr:hypothetical protein [Rhodanobacteraceae bacterium]
MTTVFFGAGLRAAAAFFTGLRADAGFALDLDGFAGLRGAAFLADLLDCLIGVALFACFGFDLAALATAFTFFAPRLAALDFEFAMSVASTLWCGGRVL